MCANLSSLTARPPWPVARKRVIKHTRTVNHIASNSRDKTCRHCSRSDSQTAASFSGRHLPRTRQLPLGQRPCLSSRKAEGDCGASRSIPHPRPRQTFLGTRNRTGGGAGCLSLLLLSYYHVTALYQLLDNYLGALWLHLQKCFYSNPGVSISCQQIRRRRWPREAQIRVPGSVLGRAGCQLPHRGCETASGARGGPRGRAPQALRARPARPCRSPGLSRHLWALLGTLPLPAAPPKEER